MRTMIRLAVALGAATAALILWQTAASAATAIEYGLIASL
jgi:hypothetical protein